VTGSAIRSGISIAVGFAVIAVAIAVAFGTLVFGHTAHDHLANGIAHFLLGGAVAVALLGVVTRLRGQFGGIQDVSAALGAAIALSIATSLEELGDSAIFANILVALIGATLLTGLFFLVVGRSRLGNLVRFVPFPVVAGFLAATGWLILKGGLEVASDAHLVVVELDYWLDHANVDQALLTLLLGAVAYVLVRRFARATWVLPATIVVGIIGFYSVTAAVGTSVQYLEEHHWLIGPLPDEPLWKAVGVPDIALVEWDTVLVQGGILTVIMVSAIALMVTQSGLELAIEQDMDVNDELERSGIVNIVVSVLGTPASWVHIPSTATAYRRSAMHWGFAALAAGIMFLAFLAGPGLVSYFPRVVAGGILVFLGIELLKEWLWNTRREMPWIDYLIVITIVVVVEVFGFIVGFGVGVVASIIIFVVRYSSQQPVRERLDGGSVHSGRDRPIPDERLLDYHDEQTVILQLQGFIFFGTAYTLYRQVKDLMEDSEERRPSFLVLDMRLVQGMDSSAASTFAKMARLFGDADAGLVIVPGSDVIAHALEQAEITPEHFERLQVFEDFDAAIESCEEQVLVEAREQLQARGTGLGDDEFLDAVFGDMMAALDVQEEFEDVVRLLGDRLSPVGTAEGDVLFEQHDENTNLYFVVNGRVVIEKLDFHGDRIRLRTLGSWNIVGELGAFLGYREPFSARVERAGAIRALAKADLDALTTEEPELARRLQSLTIQLMGSKLAKTTQAVAQL
jgi:SulP family sulfate permease